MSEVEEAPQEVVEQKIKKKKEKKKHHTEHKPEKHRLRFEITRPGQPPVYVKRVLSSLEVESATTAQYTSLVNLFPEKNYASYPREVFYTDDDSCNIKLLTPQDWSQCPSKWGPLGSPGPRTGGSGTP